MQCSCGQDLEEDDEIDTTNVSSDVCVHNFKCSDDKCNKRFEIEFHPIELREL